ncbi:glycosyltransferase [Bifidobacterium myosotis]|uniref:Glycosyltransferase family 2 protein n=1 Tax=Bifidobacterium myosotis TaxID=1630166 RepID=A0A5M9ZHJ3_9BIFI|nr:glycosyltransferase [Bifidobacterium myosotis]KAA8826597.1 glycosyltransferase family 2 protein [Bifidobacterium myosotis]
MSDGEWESVVRVVYPTQDVDQVWPLYALDWTQPMLSDALLDPRIDMEQLNLGGMNQSSFQRVIRRGLTGGKASGATNDSFAFANRTELRVNAGSRTSLCTFFNAFPAGYWRRWTNVETVRFVAEARGAGRVLLYRSNGRGLFFPAGSVNVGGVSGDISDGVRGPDVVRSEGSSVNDWQQISVEIPMVDLMDGGFFWFDAEAAAHGSGLEVRDAAWQVPVARRTAKVRTTLSIAIATFNRAPYCLNQLKAISRAAALRERLDTVYCTDQGTDHVCDQADFDEVAKDLGHQLTYIQQRNLGGSGGFSRGMYETVEAGTSSYCLLLDDDAISEPESILRAVQFADYAFKPLLVGGGMLHLDNRTMLYTQGERFDWQRMWMKPSLELGYNHDFAAEPLRDASERHQRIDEDFNGWWMCLIPVKALKTIGLSLPVFIKFDDIEYGMRAKRAGFPTVGLPGVAVWHQAWHSKDPSRTWEEYFFVRNRWIAALLLQPDRPFKPMLFESMYGDAVLGMRFIYSAMRLRHEALRDILRGPQYIVDSFPTRLGEIRELRAGFPDAQGKPSFEDFPEAQREYVSARRHPRSRKFKAKSALKAAAASFFSREDASNAERPDLAIPAQDSYWWTWLANGHVRSALVTSPDGNSVSWLKRNDPLFRRNMVECYRLVNRILRDWKRLSAEYRAYDLPSLKTWGRIFAADKQREAKH